MINEAYVSFEIAKLLKEKGFDEPTLTFYIPFEDGKVKFNIGSNEIHYNTLNEYPWIIAAPTHQMACAWLREKHFIIVITPVLFNVEYENSKWGYDIWADDNLEVSAEDCTKPLATYEEATEEALKYVLENLL